MFIIIGIKIMVFNVDVCGISNKIVVMILLKFINSL